MNRLLQNLRRFLVWYLAGIYFDFGQIGLHIITVFGAVQNGLICL